jgi:biotin carboxyl carrier protein
MPGKVIRVLVAAGDPVEAGQGLVVVEAMKMQNEMKSPKAGRVVEVKTKPHAAVAAGDVLVVVE